jgi:hypothetical protein
MAEIISEMKTKITKKYNYSYQIRKLSSHSSTNSFFAKKSPVYPAGPLKVESKIYKKQVLRVSHRGASL